MAHYRKDAASNRDALFGGGGGGGGGGARSSRSRATAARPQVSHSSSRPKSTTAAAAAAVVSSRPPPSHTSSRDRGGDDPTVTPGPSALFTSSSRLARNAPLSLLTGAAKIAKMAEAEDLRLKAKKALTRGVFSRPDPLSAANFYKRAADAYRACGENRLERLHRIAGGDCQLGQGAYATAAAEYTRAAELAEATGEETLARKRQECHKLHLDAAGAWHEMGERGRAAEATTKAAFGLVMGADRRAPLDDKALRGVEEAVEAFVGDPLNRKKHYRRTGASAYGREEDDDAQAAAARALAAQNVITDAFAHETLFKVGAELVQRRHYEAALYAHGAGTAALEHEGHATVSLARAYLAEAVLTLALGDAVAASQDFQRVHLQRTSYLASRECALEEDLIRAVDARDGEALEEARAKGGPHRAALASLDPAVRGLVGEIRAGGRAKTKGRAGAAAGGKAGPAVGAGNKGKAAGAGNERKAAVAAPAAGGNLHGEALEHDTTAGFAEMDDIMNQMGLDDDDGGDDDSVDLT